MDTEDEEVEHVPGCPLCENNDPELERLMREFAQWLYGVVREDQKKAKKEDDLEKK